MASFDWGKGSAVATSQYWVAVGLVSKWKGSIVLQGHVEEMMAAAKVALNTQVRAATGVEPGFAAADDWLATRRVDPALVKQVLMAESAIEYGEVMRLMSEEACMWVQIKSSEWEDNCGLVTDSAWGSALRLAYAPKGSIMSEVEEAPASGGLRLALADRGLVAKRHGMEDLVMVRWEVEIPAGRKLLVGLGNGRGDDLDEVLKDKGRLPSKWADILDDTGMDGDEMDLGDDVLP